MPAFVGLEVGDAHELAFTARVVAVNADAATPLPVSGTVVAQSPRAGVRVQPADAVAILVDPVPGRGGGGRPVEPPTPDPLDPAGAQ